MKTAIALTLLTLLFIVGCDTSKSNNTSLEVQSQSSFSSLSSSSSSVSSAAQVSSTSQSALASSSVISTSSSVSFSSFPSSYSSLASRVISTPEGNTTLYYGEGVLLEGLEIVGDWYLTNKAPYHSRDTLLTFSEDGIETLKFSCDNSPITNFEGYLYGVTENNQSHYYIADLNATRLYEPRETFGRDSTTNCIKVKPYTSISPFSSFNYMCKKGEVIYSDTSLHFDNNNSALEEVQLQLYSGEYITLYRGKGVKFGNYLLKDTLLKGKYPTEGNNTVYTNISLGCDDETCIVTSLIIPVGTTPRYNIFGVNKEGDTLYLDGGDSSFTGPCQTSTTLKIVKVLDDNCYLIDARDFYYGEPSYDESDYYAKMCKTKD